MKVPNRQASDLRRKHLREKILKMRTLSNDSLNSQANAKRGSPFQLIPYPWSIEMLGLPGQKLEINDFDNTIVGSSATLP